MISAFVSKKTYVVLALGCLVVLGILGFSAMQRYTAYQEAVTELESGKVRLTKLTAEIEETRRSIDRLTKERQEFQKMLFEERDVPAFLDGISASALKTSVYVMEMKTEQFRDVTVPKEVAAAGKSARAKLYEGYEEQQQKTPKEQLKEMLTLVAMPIRMKVHGSFESLVHFLNSIEGYRQLLTISNVEISTRSDYPQLTCEFILRIYSLKKLGELQV